jgi:FkbM family methyltransferase
VIDHLRRAVKRAILFTPFDELFGRLDQTVARAASRVSRELAEPAEAHLSNGLTLRLPGGMPSSGRLRAGTYEPEVTSVLHSLLESGMTFVDGGANVGYYTMLAARKVGAGGRVYAFEPDPIAFEYLQSNIRDNGASNVVSVHRALADTVRIAVFTPSDVEGGFVANQASSWSSRTIEAMSLDSYFAEQGWPQVDIVKLDVEGSEGLVLQGMKELSSRNRSLQLLMECNCRALDRAATSLSDMTEFLIDLGFQSARVVERGLAQVSLSAPLPRSGLIYNILLTKN